MSLQRDPENREGKTLHKFVDFANKRVLEVGCGEGRLTWKYAPASALTVGLDPDHDALRIARLDAQDKSCGTQVHFAGAARTYPLSKRDIRYRRPCLVALMNGTCEHGACSG
jgi:ubiquinone/menaquinone biosynthesis C-methylase UbiE